MVQSEIPLLLRVSEPNDHSEYGITHKGFDFTPISLFIKYIIEQICNGLCINIAQI